MKDGGGEPTVDQENFHRESNAMRMIKHPKIIRLREKLQSENNYYLVLDYCEDGDLKMMLETKGVMPEGDALDALRQLSSGFLELHRLGIMHRDFKPANVFIHKGNFIIGDLGMAKKASATATKVGTPITMAPEVSDESSGKKYDSTVDLFSLGVTFYYMLYREWPWEVDHRLAVSMRTKVGPKLRFPDDDDISPETKTLLRGMIALRPDRLNWLQFFQLLDKLEIPGTFLKADNQAFNDQLFKMGLKLAAKGTELQTDDEDGTENESGLNLEKVKLLLALGLDPELLQLLQLVEIVNGPSDPQELMKRPDVKFWFGQIEHNRNLVRFYSGHCDFLKQVWKDRAKFPAGFGDVILQMALALIHKARTVIGICRGYLTKQIPTEGLPSIEAYLKTDHSKTVLQDLDKFKEAVQGNYMSLMSKAALEAKGAGDKSPKQGEWFEIIKIVEIEKQMLPQVNEYCKKRLGYLLSLIPHIDHLKSEDFKDPVTSKMLVCFLRIYQMIFDDDELPKPKSDELETQWNRFFKQSINVDLLRTNFYKAKGRLS